MNLRYDLRSLQIFAAVVEQQNIAKAAAQHNIAASAISKRISDLEATVGVPLLVRQSRGVEPTAAGMALLAHSRTVLAQIERLQSEMADFAGGAKGHVRMLVNKSAIVQFLPRDLRIFGELYPEIRIDLEEENSPTILKGVAEDRAEIGIFTRGAGSPDDLVTFPYRQDRLMALVPDSHPIAGHESVRFSDILPYDLIGLHAISAWNALLSRGARDAGSMLNVRYRVTSFDAVIKMASEGLGVALVPDGVLDGLSPANLRGIPLDEPWAKRELQIAIRSADTLSIAAQRLVDHLVEGGRADQG
jgi:DNA-binding transcriptional LysR family regulator